ncbi:unnamed protein product [Amoebophrya sp. A25]|nr:unnamed protein product [Amoebophrya sp. A25]|eukprot:GSA25T00019192001.1
MSALKSGRKNWADMHSDDSDEDDAWFPKRLNADQSESAKKAVGGSNISTKGTTGGPVVGLSKLSSQPIRDHGDSFSYKVRDPDADLDLASTFANTFGDVEERWRKNEKLEQKPLMGGDLGTGTSSSSSSSKSSTRGGHRDQDIDDLANANDNNMHIVDENSKKAAGSTSHQRAGGLVDVDVVNNQQGAGAGANAAGGAGTTCSYEGARERAGSGATVSTGRGTSGSGSENPEGTDASATSEIFGLDDQSEHGSAALASMDGTNIARATSRRGGGAETTTAKGSSGVSKNRSGNGSSVVPRGNGGRDIRVADVSAPSAVHKGKGKDGKKGGNKGGGGKSTRTSSEHEGGEESRIAAASKNVVDAPGPAVFKKRVPGASAAPSNWSGWGAQPTGEDDDEEEDNAQNESGAAGTTAEMFPDLATGTSAASTEASKPKLRGGFGGSSGATKFQLGNGSSYRKGSSSKEKDNGTKSPGPPASAAGNAAVADAEQDKGRIADVSQPQRAAASGKSKGKGKPEAKLEKKSWADMSDDDIDDGMEPHSPIRNKLIEERAAPTNWAAAMTKTLTEEDRKKSEALQKAASNKNIHDWNTNAAEFVPGASFAGTGVSAPEFYDSAFTNGFTPQGLPTSHKRQRGDLTPASSVRGYYDKMPRMGAIPGGGPGGPCSGGVTPMSTASTAEMIVAPYVVGWMPTAVAFAEAKKAAMTKTVSTGSSSARGAVLFPEASRPMEAPVAGGLNKMELNTEALVDGTMTDAERQAASKQKKIDRVKSHVAYARYLKAVPKDTRADEPSTPSATDASQSNRAFRYELEAFRSWLIEKYGHEDEDDHQAEQK